MKNEEKVDFPLHYEVSICLFPVRKYAQIQILMTLIVTSRVIRIKYVNFNHFTPVKFECMNNVTMSLKHIELLLWE